MNNDTRHCISLDKSFQVHCFENEKKLASYAHMYRK